MMFSNHRKPRSATRISYAPTDASFKQKYQLTKNYVIINSPASALGERYLFLASSSSAAYAPPRCYAALFPASVSRETDSYHLPPEGGEAVYIQAARLAPPFAPGRALDDAKRGKAVVGFLCDIQRQQAEMKGAGGRKVTADGRPDVKPLSVLLRAPSMRSACGLFKINIEGCWLFQRNFDHFVKCARDVIHNSHISSPCCPGKRVQIHYKYLFSHLD